MSQSSSFIKSWVPKKAIVPLLVLSMFPHVMILSIFSMNSTFTASFLDVDVDDIQFLFGLAYATIVCTLFFHTRFFQYFNIRSYLLVMTMASMLVLFLMTLTVNPAILLILRGIQGPLMLLEGCILLPIIISQIEGEKGKLMAYVILYCLIMSGDKISTSLVKFAIENFSHNMILCVVIAYHLLALFLFVIMLQEKRMFGPKKPLYQLNLPAIIFMAIAMISGAFTLIYGKRLYWFESAQIQWSFAMFLIFIGLFVFQQRTSKRPIFHFEILFSKRVIAGLLLFFIFYFLRSSTNNLYQVMQVVWRWPWYYVLKVQYFNVAGTIIGSILAYVALRKQLAARFIFMVGFALIGCALLFFGQMMYPDTQTLTIGLALVVQGIGQGIIFAPLVLYMLGSVHALIGGSVSQAGTAMRFWTTMLGYSVMQNATLALTTKHQMLMSRSLDVTRQQFSNYWNDLLGKWQQTRLDDQAMSIAATSVKSNLYNQALLVSNMEIYFTLSMLAFFTVVIILFARPVYTRVLRRENRGL